MDERDIEVQLIMDLCDQIDTIRATIEELEKNRRNRLRGRRSGGLA